MASWYRSNGENRFTLSLHVQPGAKKTETAGEHGAALKVRLAAPPVDGKANEALIRFIAAKLGLPRCAVTLRSGHNARQKVLEITGCTEAGIASLAG